MKYNELEREYFKRWTNGREQASSIVVRNDEDMAKVTAIRKQETKATDIEKNSSLVSKESGVMAILKARHPERFN